MLDKVKELECIITENASKYYTGGVSISDREFDNYVNELREIDPSNELLTKVGWGFDVNTVTLDKVNHKVPMASLSNITPESYVTGDTYTREGIYTPKYDGAAVQLTYKYGVLFRAVTRGDGQVGHDVTSKLQHVVPAKLTGVLSEVTRVDISGEYLMKKSLLRELYGEQVAFRNIASGFLLRKEVNVEEAKKFDFVAFRVTQFQNDIDNSGSYSTEILHDRVTMLESLKESGLNTTNYYKLDDRKDYDYEFIKDKLSNNDYDIDGIVAPVQEMLTEVKYDEDYEIRTMDYFEVAIKEVTDTAEVEVSSVKYSTTRTGRVVPVVSFEPVHLSGAWIQRASGHNAYTILSNEIKKGSKILVTRSGEVIPVILGVYNDEGEFIQVSKS